LSVAADHVKVIEFAVLCSQQIGNNWWRLCIWVQLSKQMQHIQGYQYKDFGCFLACVNSVIS
jgi:hypothetical protein